MKIAIVAPSPVPFVLGGAENLWQGLLEALNSRPGVQADLLKLPSRERNMGELLDTYRRFADLDLSHFDLVISTKYPAWAIRHPNHVVYLQHTLRGLYDVYPADLPTGFDSNALRSLGVPTHIVKALADYRAADVEFDEVLNAIDAAFRKSSDSPQWAFPGPLSRAVIRLLDAVAMRADKVAHYAAISDVVAAREGYFPVGAKVAVHHHPTHLKGLTSGPQETIFSASRLDPAKRINLIIEAYIRSGVNVPLHIAGSGSDEARLREVAGTHPGIRFLGRIPDAELAQEYARAICVPFVPRDEDYGLITLEAMLASKPVITTTDSGGPTELIENGRTGFIVEPEPASLARAMHRLCDDRVAAREMGLAAQVRASSLRWDTLCDALLAGGRPVQAGGPTVITKRAKPLLGVLNTFPIAPAVSGGKLRLLGLYSRVAEQFKVQFVNLAPSHLPRQVRELSADFCEELAPKSSTFDKHEQRLQESLGASVEDLTAAIHPTSAPQWLEAIDAMARRADLIVCSHPYALPALRTVSKVAFVYEAHNVEADLKADIFGTHRWAVDRVSMIESLAVRDAVLVAACSAQDRERLRKLYQRQDGGADLIVVPNGIDLSATPLRNFARSAQRRTTLGVNRPLALFMGSAHGPNIDAARVVMEASAQLPHVDFLMLGSVCSVVESWDRPANVGLAGVVSDAEKASWLELCDVGLNPMISGSGTNLKLIEYAAAGVPIVSTEFGVRGAGFAPGREYVSAAKDSFATGIKTALGTARPKSDGIVRKARQWVEADADWTAIAATYAGALKQVLA
ncbi:glycosyltransferase [Caballeronia udeis]|uniref:Glycosyltransferase n=1 Tax=Caballeronia udeis TaxID=1232866 RepID=A0A158F071_9BURK|nr:glycosyltransferase family 4 protein [Caballeronia udeis]SAL12390.1 glycosyltransferase [Caballeronia udeis]